MRRICCFCETWASGGIESFLNNVLKHMDRANLQVDIVAARMDESVFTAEMKANGIRFMRCSSFCLQYG